MRRRWQWLTVVLLCGGAVAGCKRNQSVTTMPSSAPTSQPSTLPAVVELVLAPVPSRPLQQRIGAPWSGGQVAFAVDPLEYSIAHDYDQRLDIRLVNRSDKSVKVYAELAPLDGGLIGNFTDAGSEAQPLELPAQGGGNLTLSFFAQDASRPGFHTQVTVRDAATREILAAAPLAVEVSAPHVSLEVKVEGESPGTLARRVTVVNRGDPVTDLVASPGAELAGRVIVLPTVQHVRLEHDRSFSFTVMPILSTSFKSLKGNLMLRAGGQEKPTPMSFDLPSGKSVFVAAGFSTTSYSAAGFYCTNNPNTNSPIGGPPSTQPAACPPVSPDCFGLDSRNKRISEAGKPRVYTNGKNPRSEDPNTYTLKKNESWKIHPGTDITSRDHFGSDKKGNETYNVSKLPYKACVSGTVVDIKYGQIRQKSGFGFPNPKSDSSLPSVYWDPFAQHTGFDEGTYTVTLKLDDGSGNVIQFLHSSAVYVHVGDKVEPGTTIGQTGDTSSPGAVHLHVQARDKDWRIIDPDCAIDHMPNKLIDMTPPDQRNKDQGQKSGASGKSAGKGGAATTAGSKAGASKSSAGTPANAPAKPSTTTSAPRKHDLRRAYAMYRAAIDQDNSPESMWAFALGASGEEIGLQTWHSDGGDPWGLRQIFVAVWDRKTGAPLVPATAITLPGWSQWPAVAALPGQRAIVTFETAGNGEQPRGIAWSLSEKGYAAWSAPKTLEGTGAANGPEDFDPLPVVLRDGSVLLVWQRGVGEGSRIMMAKAQPTDELTFEAPRTPDSLPAGASRPVVRIAADHSLHMLFQSAAHPLDSDTAPTSIIFYTSSRDAGATWSQPVQLSAASVDSGEPDLLIDGQHLYAAFRAGPDFASRVACAASDDGGATWSPPATVTDDRFYAEYPALFNDRGRIGLEFYGDERAAFAKAQRHCASCAPDGTALKRYSTSFAGGKWSSPLRLLTDFPSVQSAWLEVTFGLKSPRSAYSPHDVTILFNGEELWHQKDIIPEGTYLLPVDPRLLRLDEHGLPYNVIGLRTVHMNPGHYMSAANFRLLARHRVLERLVVASSQEEADALVGAESESVNHKRPDVGLFAPLANAPAIPSRPAPGQTIKIAVRVINVGQAPAKNVRIEVYEGELSGSGEPRGASIAPPLTVTPELHPFLAQDMEVSFTYGGAAQYTLLVRSDGGDFDLRNNSRLVTFETPPSPRIAPLMHEFSGPVAMILGDSPDAPYSWRLLDADSGREIYRVQQGTRTGELVPGRYQLALQRYQHDGKEVLFPKIIEHKTGQTTRVSVRSEIELVLPDWAAPVHSWSASRPGKPEDIVQQHNGAHTVMLLPPGEYQVSILPIQYRSALLVLPQTVKLGEDEHVVVRLDSGVAVPEILRNMSPPFEWALWSEDGKNKIQYCRDGWTPLAVPPGKYRWSVQMRPYTTPATLFPEAIAIPAGPLVTPPDPGIFELRPSAWSGKPYAHQLVPEGKTEPIAQASAHDLVPLPVPPGTYTLSIQPDQFNSSTIIVSRRVRIVAGRTTRFPLDSGVEIHSSPKARPLYSLSFTRSGEKTPAQTMRNPRWGPIVLRPGVYHLAFQPTQFDSISQPWPAPITVRDGELAKFIFDSGIQFARPAEAKSGAEFQVLDEKCQVVQQGRDFSQPVWLPPGVYSVQVRAKNYAPWKALAANVKIEAGKVAELAAPLEADTTSGGTGAGLRR